MPRPYLTASQVAKLLQLNVETVYALITREGLPATRIGRGWRFDESEVRRWFYKRRDETEITGHTARGRDHGSQTVTTTKSGQPTSAGVLEP